jgi:hypothetical protein
VRPDRAEAIEIDRVVDRVHRNGGAEHVARLDGDAFRIRQHRIAAARLACEKPRRQPSSSRIVVQVPHQPGVGRPRAGAEKVHFQAVAVNDVGLKFEEAPLQAPRISQGRR